MEVEDGEHCRPTPGEMRSNIKPEAGEASDRLPSPIVASLCRQRAPCPANPTGLLLTPADGLYDIRERRDEPVR